MSGRALRAAFPRTLPIMAGYLFLGLAWGILLRDKGFGVEWAIMISGLVYAGSMQFVLVGLLTTAFSPITTLFMTLMVNARHLFYGLSMLGSYSKCRKWKPYLIFSLTDETYSLVCDGHVPADVEPEAYYLAVSALDQLYWVMGSVLGVLLGQILPWDLTGIDFAMTALFVVIATEQWENASKSGKPWLTAHLPALLGFGLTVCSLLLVGSDKFLLLSMGLMLLCFYVQFQRKGAEA